MSARSKVGMALAAALGLGFAVFSTSWAGHQQQPAKQGPNKMEEPPKDAKDSDTTKSVQHLELANQLIAFGRQEKHAESLLVAAQILHKNPSQALTSGYTASGGPPDKKSEGNNAKALVAEARKISSSPHCEAMATATEKMLQESTRGVVGGPKKDVFTIRPGETITWKPISFRGNEKAVVDIEIFVPGAMTLEIIDQNNNIVARDNVRGHYYNCVWYPAWTGPFTFRLTNHDRMSFNCDLLTN
jgi:hypothetical protein